MKAVNYYIVIDKIKEEPKSISRRSTRECLSLQNEDVRYSKGKAISVGNAVNGIDKGNIVWYDKHAGHGFEWEENYYYIIKHADVVIIE